MDETTSSQRSGTGHKTRRPHKKSRYGCMKCKERRIKCDELKPKCSRCSKMNLTCRYPKRPVEPPLIAFEDSWAESIDPLLLQELRLEASRSEYGFASPESPGHSPAITGSPLSTASSCLSSGQGSRDFDLPLRSQAARSLSPGEFELFKHYLEHTSRDLTVGDDDQYTLRIGIPTLACESKPLMRSVLALAAVCKCRDIVATSNPREARGQVLKLVSLAQRYHMESLRETQATLHEVKQYDHVLANAAMMGMYGSGSYCTRIWLVKTATPDDTAPCDFAPKHSEWISLFRAVRLAYVGLLNDHATRADGIVGTEHPNGAASTYHSQQTRHEYKLSPHARHPRPPLAHILAPILSATIPSALSQLDHKAAEIASMPHPTNLDPNPLQDCFTALSIFNAIVADTFPTANIESRFVFKTDQSSVDPAVTSDRLAELSPWLRRYTARITSMVPSRLPRRSIMAFVHKVPAGFLRLVEDMIGVVQELSETGGANGAGGEEDCMEGVGNGVGGGSGDGGREPSLAHQFAVEIFAHWLVLVILLDDVWWIGGIGGWELGRIVSLRKRGRWRGCLWNRDEAWWPESMCEVWRQVEKHKSDGSE